MFFIIIYLDIFEDTIGIVGPHLPAMCVRDTLIPMSLDTLKDTNFRFSFAFKIELIIYPTRKICLTFLFMTCTSMPFAILILCVLCLAEQFRSHTDCVALYNF